MRLKPFALPVMAALLSTAGCQSAAQSEEQTLAAAGFTMKPAQTAAQQATIENLPQRKLTPVSKDGEIGYVFADAKGCNCVYTGSQEDYGRYQNLNIRRQIAEEEELASMDWDVWDGFGPWF